MLELEKPPGFGTCTDRHRERRESERTGATCQYGRETAGGLASRNTATTSGSRDTVDMVRHESGTVENAVGDVTSKGQMVH